MAEKALVLPSAILRDMRSKPYLEWPNVVKAATRMGVKDPDKLTDIVFYMNHKDMTRVVGNQLAVKTIEPSQNGLIEEWKFYRKMFGGHTVSKISENHTYEHLCELALLKIKNMKTSRPEFEREKNEEYASMIHIVTAFLKGAPIDDKYYQFKTSDAQGRFTPGDNVTSLHLINETHALYMLKPHYFREQHVEKVENIILGAYKNVENEVNLLFRWQRLVSNTSDAPIRNSQELFYIEEMKRRVLRNKPISVYYAFKNRFSALGLSVPMLNLLPYMLEK